MPSIEGPGRECLSLRSARAGSHRALRCDAGHDIPQTHSTIVVHTAHQLPTTYLGVTPRCTQLSSTQTKTHSKKATLRLGCSSGELLNSYQTNTQRHTKTTQNKRHPHSLGLEMQVHSTTHKK